MDQIKKNYINNHGVSQSDKDIFNHYFSFYFFDCFKENILLIFSSSPIDIDIRLTEMKKNRNQQLLLHIGAKINISQ